MMTTAVSFPLTEIAVCPEPEMALNAYSARRRSSTVPHSLYLFSSLTYLVQTSLGREDGEVSVEPFSWEKVLRLALDPPVVRGPRHGGWAKKEQACAPAERTRTRKSTRTRVSRSGPILRLGVSASRAPAEISYSQVILKSSTSSSSLPAVFAGLFSFVLSDCILQRLQRS